MRKLLLIILLFPLFASAQTPMFKLIAKRSGAASFIPTDTAGCTFWVAGYKQVGLSNGDPVGTWTDFSGNANDATASGSDRPVYTTGVLNGLPVINFTQASGQYMTAPVSLSQPYTVFVVARTGVTGGNQYYLDGAVTANTGVVSNLGSNTTLGSYAGSAISVSATATNWHYITAVFDNTSSLVAIDGVVTTGTVGTAAIVGITIGANGGAHANFLNGDIAEIIYYDHALTLTGRTTVQAYLASKYGL